MKRTIHTAVAAAAVATLLALALVIVTPAAATTTSAVVERPLGMTGLEVDGQTVSVVVVERTHRSDHGVLTYQYLFYAAATPGTEPARALRLVSSTGRLAAPIPAALLLEPADPEPQPVEPDPIQDVIDELEAYKSVIAGVKSRLAEDDPNRAHLCKAIAEIDKAIAKLKILQGGGPPPAGIEGEIEGHLDKAIACIDATNPLPGSTLARIRNALADLRANLF